jgi:tetratricopeptide (TPR) repeat protein
MEINGILTKMMHDHDRLRHSFYVEESYVIPWMYPYLSPHGLIMKINADRTPYDAATAAKDADFWDWYVRRLLDDPMYRRDFAGQKSFSKLRAAIAGLYGKQGRHRECAQAFRESVLLYPASPEASFRYAQESLMLFRRWNVVLEMMDYIDRIDPNNRRTIGLRGYVVRVSQLIEETQRLEKMRGEGKMTPQDIFALAGCYFELGRVHEAGEIAKTLVDGASDAGSLQAIARILVESRKDADAEKCLNKYLKLNPQGDANAWADLAKLQHRSGRRQAAQQSFIAGYQIDRQALFGRLQKDQELYEIAAPLFQRRR